jgi:diguanylate cyclase (GGDEF)-like protein
MKKLILAIAILFGYAGASWGGAPPGPLTSISAINALSSAQANQGLPVVFEATVTHYPGYENLLFVQEDGHAIFVQDTIPLKLRPGDRILVRGKTQGSFYPIILSESITLLHHGALPKPFPASFDDLIRARFDGALVKVHATIRTAELGWSPSVRVTYLQMLMDGGYIEGMLDSTDEQAVHKLLDAEVEVTGVAGGKFDNKMQLSGILLHVSSLADVKIIKRADIALSSLPITPMDKILSSYHVQELGQRIRVRGIITYYHPGSAVVLQDGSRSIWVATPARSSLRIGDLADATGFPDTRNGFLILDHAQIEDRLVYSPVQPELTNWRQLGFWSSNRADGHLYDLVSIEGQVAAEVRGAMQDEYVIAADGRLFSAIYSHPDAASQLALPPMKMIAPGSRVRVSGICILDADNPYNTNLEVPFHILLRSFDDIAVVAAPSPINTRNLLLALGVLLLLVFAVIGRGWALERKVRHQTALLAAVEQQRSRILEDINGSRPLAEIIEKIVSMVSSMLDGAPCWCEVADGATVGNSPREPHNLEIIRVQIEARSGPALGAMLAAFDHRTPVTSRRAEALADGVRLATLAIETRRLYSDLRRRSEFDLLTDVHNRFSLEKRLDEQIAAARENASVFGLIYIDLDKFKQINDLYGHHVGDLYLHQVVGRMKQQLRTDDLLARLGGDEFVALLTTIRNRVGVEEIAQRLELCFNEPFTIEGHLIQGTASFGIATYPQDGACRDELLNAADTAMYAVKNLHRQKAQSEAESPAIPV